MFLNKYNKQINMEFRNKQFLKPKDWINKDKFHINDEIHTNYYLSSFTKDNKYNEHLLSLDPNKVKYLKQNPEKINWYWLSFNPAAIDLLKANPKKINWDNLSFNPAAISLLKANPTRINWNNLSLNPAAISLLKANPDKINWNNLSLNPEIYEYDYDTIKKYNKIINEEIIDRYLNANYVF
jgi:hypothetical protein